MSMMEYNVKTSFREIYIDVMYLKIVGTIFQIHSTNVNNYARY